VWGKLTGKYKQSKPNGFLFIMKKKKVQKQIYKAKKHFIEPKTIYLNTYNTSNYMDTKLSPFR
jgi:hypothetical protein